MTLFCLVNSYNISIDQHAQRSVIDIRSMLQFRRWVQSIVVVQSSPSVTTRQAVS